MVDRFFEKKMNQDNNKYSHELVLGQVNISQLAEMFDYIHPKGMTLSKFKSIVNKFAMGKDFSDWKRRLDYIHNDSKPLARTKEKTIILYGEKYGNERWNSYCNAQSVTNTLEYKKEKYGMTKEEFDEYNKSRAVTLENMIARHGEEGKKKFQEYCDRQSYAGCAKEYFIEKYGEEKGIQEYENVNFKKSHNLKSYITKYGMEEGQKRFMEFWNKIFNSKRIYSKQSQELFDLLCEKLSDDIKKTARYASLNSEFSIFDDISEQQYFYDFVIEDLKFCVEYNGDFWHGNPNKYTADDVLNAGGRKRKYGDIWMSDKLKSDYLRSKGYDVYTVWEHDYTTDPEKVIGELYEKIIEKYQLGNH